MAKLAGKAVNDLIVEYYGPVTGRNYNTSGAASPVAPAINVVVHGTGAVQLQESQTFKMQGNSGTNNFTHDKIADPTTWVNLGTPIDASSGLTSVVPTVDSSFSTIRAIVSTAGDGHVVIQSDWN